jgi:hypothetical protein
MAAVPTRAEYSDQRHEPEENHAPTAGHERRRSPERQSAGECLSTDERFRVQPYRDGAREQDGDEVADY